MSASFESIPESTPAGGYVPASCNIGPAEIARRRRAALAGTAAALGTFAGLMLAGVDRRWRLVVAIPAAGAIVSWLQVRLHFCVGFASRGVYNFDELGAEVTIEDPAARRADRRRALGMTLAGLAGGALLGLVAVALPPTGRRRRQ